MKSSSSVLNTSSLFAIVHESVCFKVIEIWQIEKGPNLSRSLKIYSDNFHHMYVLLVLWEWNSYVPYILSYPANRSCLPDWLRYISAKCYNFNRILKRITMFILGLWILHTQWFNIKLGDYLICKISQLLKQVKWSSISKYCPSSYIYRENAPANPSVHTPMTSDVVRTYVFRKYKYIAGVWN